LRNLPGPGSIARGDRRDLTARPLRDRRTRLEDVVAGSELVFPVRRLAADGLEAWRQVIERGYEGFVAKDEASAYAGGATRRWLKVKQKGWAGAEDRWQRRISTGVRAAIVALGRARPCNSAGSASAALLLLLLERGAFARGLPLAFLLAHGQSPIGFGGSAPVTVCRS
jgi:hypothetical protein